MHFLRSHDTVLHTVQKNFHAVDVNKYRYIQTPIGLLIFEVIGHVNTVQCEVLDTLSLFLHDIMTCMHISNKYNDTAEEQY